MKITWKNLGQIGVMLFVLYLATTYWSGFASLLLKVVNVASPLLLGAVIAYVLNILMSFYERLVPKTKVPKPFKGIYRPVTILLALGSLIAIVVLVIRVIVPELILCVGMLIDKLPALVESAIETLEKNDQIGSYLSTEIASVDWKEIVKNVANWVGTGIGGAVNMVSGVFSTTVTVVIGFVFCIYILSSKETLFAQCKQLGKTYLKPELNEKIAYVLNTVNQCFHKFIVGQCLEAVIIGALCTVGMLIFRFPYAPMIGTLVGFTALIPVAGAYIGAAVGALMILTISPIKAALFIVYLVILQQLEGNLIYPRVVGSSIGLPGLWVLAAVTISGGLLGIGGMLLGVPLAAAIYQLVKNDMKKRQAK